VSNCQETLEVFQIFLCSFEKQINQVGLGGNGGGREGNGLFPSKNLSRMLST
jgi:hypothetical protein